MKSHALNSAQQKVVDHSGGPLLVVAGAGTGKTRVIVERIAQLLNKGVEPGSLLAVTFTEKAAAEMLERVLELRGRFEVELPIMTFNAFGESLLREFNVDIGLNRNFLLLGESAKLVFLRQHADELELEYYAPVSNPEGLLPDLADYFSKLKQHVVTPERYQKFVKSIPKTSAADHLEVKKHRELARAYEHYLRICQEQNVIDYDDQIYRAIELLQTRPNIKAQLQQRYHAIMVDEFQDTNPMQSQLIDLLVNKQQNLMVVGDDDQSIYGFRGATLANILDFKARYPEATEIALTQNYRSSQAILDSAYSLIQHNNPHRLEAQLGINKQLRATFDGVAPSCQQFAGLDQELYWLAKDIVQQLASGTPPGEIAVLCRRNTTARLVSQTLQLEDIEHVVIGERYQLYKTEVVRLVVEALRCVVDPAASVSLYHTLSGALWNIPAEELAPLASQAKRQHTSLETVLRQQPDQMSDRLQAALSTLWQWRQQATDRSVGRLVYTILEDSGYKQQLYKDGLADLAAANTITHLSDFFRSLQQFELIATQPTALQYLESLPVLEAAGESNEDGTLEVSRDKVNILTIHKAKGLEWLRVYIPDCTEGSFPLRAGPGGLALPAELAAQTTSEADNHLAEERRLMYVATTRAKQALLLSFSTKHTGPAQRKPSRFLGELFPTLPETQAREMSPPTPRLELFNLPGPAASVPLPASLFDGKLVHLTVSQITTFLNCPLDFYYRFVLGVPESPSFAANYGLILHKLVETINQKLLVGKSPRLAELEKQLEEDWQAIGYLSARHVQRAKAQARATLQAFYQRHVVEENRPPHLVEWPFRTHLQPENLVITGRLDAVFQSKKVTEIRDYKTSSTVDTPEKATRRARASDQLTLYALVWQELHGKLPETLSLEFIDTQMIGEVHKTPRGIATMRAKLAGITEAVKQRRFEPGKDHRYCQHPELTTA